ncbi:MAG: glycosyltransferase [Myxococcota bacterium]
MEDSIDISIVIPIYNEEGILSASIADLTSELEAKEGWDHTYEIILSENGSTDRTVEVAREHGVDHIVQLGHNQGLARAFMAGLEACLRRGADVIVNTDGDNTPQARP